MPNIEHDEAPFVPDPALLAEPDRLLTLYGISVNERVKLVRQLAGAVEALDDASAALAQVGPPYSDRMYRVIDETQTKVEAVLRRVREQSRR